MAMLYKVIKYFNVAIKQIRSNTQTLKPSHSLNLIQRLPVVDFQFFKFCWSKTGAVPELR